jgi:hypothetical protein
MSCILKISRMQHIINYNKLKYFFFSKNIDVFDDTEYVISFRIWTFGWTNGETIIPYKTLSKFELAHLFASELSSVRHDCTNVISIEPANSKFYPLA